MTISKEKVLTIAMLISMVIWGMSWSSAKVLSQYGSSLNLVFLRFLIVSLTLLPLLAILKIDLVPRKRSFPYLIGVALFMGVYSLTFFGGLHFGLAGAGGVLVTTINPVFAYLIGVIVSRKLPNKRQLLGLGIGIIGGLVLIQVWERFDHLMQSGNLFFISAALLWAIMSKINSFGARTVNPFNFIFWVNVLATVVFACIVDFSEIKTMLVEGDTRFWLNILYMGMINSAGATVCFLYATTQIGAERASSFNYLVPICALIGSWLFLNEQVQWFTLVGGCIAVVAVLVLNSGKNK